MEGKGTEAKRVRFRTSTLDPCIIVFHVFILPHFIFSNGERRIWVVPRDCIDIMFLCGGIICFQKHEIRFSVWLFSTWIGGCLTTLLSFSLLCEYITPCHSVLADIYA